MPQKIRSLRLIPPKPRSSGGGGSGRGIGLTISCHLYGNRADYIPSVIRVAFLVMELGHSLAKSARNEQRQKFRSAPHQPCGLGARRRHRIDLFARSAIVVMFISIPDLDQRPTRLAAQRALDIGIDILMGDQLKFCSTARSNLSDDRMRRIAERTGDCHLPLFVFYLGRGAAVSMTPPWSVTSTRQVAIRPVPSRRHVYVQ